MGSGNLNARELAFDPNKEGLWRCSGLDTKEPGMRELEARLFGDR